MSSLLDPILINIRTPETSSLPSQSYQSKKITLIVKNSSYLKGVCIPHPFHQFFFAYFFLLVFGFVHGLFWFALYPKLFVNKTELNKGWVRKQVVFGWVAIYVSNFLLFLFFRLTMKNWFVPCFDQSELTLECLFKEQHPRYICFYLMQFVCLLAAVGCWMYQGIKIGFWINQTRR